MCMRFVFLLITRIVAWLQLSRREERWKTAEILILRHQLAVLQGRQPCRPKLNWADRALLAAMLGLIPKARRQGLRLLVSPDTIVRWHRDIVRRRWAARSMRGRTGRSDTSPPGAVALGDRGWPETGRVTAHHATSVFAGFRFPPEMISLAVRWYLRYGLSYRDVEELLAERGVTVDHVTIYRWVQRFTPEFIEAGRPCRHAPGSRWFVDETYVKVAGHWTYLYRAVDEHGQVIDVLLSTRRDLAAARRFFTRALCTGTIPAEVTTDRAPVYPRVLDQLIPSALHTVEQYRLGAR